MMFLICKSVPGIVCFIFNLDIHMRDERERDDSIVQFLPRPKSNKHENCKVSNFKQALGGGLEQKTRRDLFLTRFKNHKNNLKLYRHQKILRNCHLLNSGGKTTDEKKLYEVEVDTFLSFQK